MMNVIKNELLVDFQFRTVIIPLMFQPYQVILTTATTGKHLMCFLCLVSNHTFSRLFVVLKQLCLEPRSFRDSQDWQ